MKAKIPANAFTSLEGFHNYIITGEHTYRDYKILTEYSGGKFKRELIAKLDSNSANNDRNNESNANNNFLVIVFDKNAIFEAASPLTDESKNISKRDFFNELKPDEINYKSSEKNNKNVLGIIDTAEDNNFLFYICDFTDCILTDFIFETKDSLYLKTFNMEPILYKPILELFDGMHEIHKDQKKILSVLLDPKEMYVKKDKVSRKIILQFKPPELVYLMTLIKLYLEPDLFPSSLHVDLLKIFDNTPIEKKIDDAVDKSKEKGKDNEEKGKDNANEEEIITSKKAKDNNTKDPNTKDNNTPKIIIIKKPLDVSIIKSTYIDKENNNEFYFDFWAFGCLTYYLIFEDDPFKVKNFKGAIETLESKEAEFKMEACYISEFMETFIRNCIDSKINLKPEDKIYDELRRIFKKGSGDSKDNDEFLDECHNAKTVIDLIKNRIKVPNLMGVRVKVVKNEENNK